MTLSPNVVAGSACVAVGVVLGLWSLLGRRAAPRRRITAKRAQKNAMLASLGSPSTDLREALLAKSVGERVLQPGMASLARRVRRLTPAGMVAALERRIAMAGVTATWPIERVLAWKLLAGGLGAALGAVVLIGDPSGKSLFIGLIITAAAYFVPDYLLFHFSVARQEEIQRSLADTLEQVTIMVEAGLGFEAAVERATRSGESALKFELARMLRDIQLGMPRSRALERLLDRTDVPDLRSFVHAVAQAENYGIPIAQILRVQAQELRLKRSQKAEERAMKVPVKITIPLVVFILPTLFIVMLGPAVIRLANGPLGG